MENCYSDNPVMDAARHYAELERLEKRDIPEHKCNACEQGFYSGTGGVKISDEEFCKECVEAGEHYNFYRHECGLTDPEIYHLTEIKTEL